MFCTVPQASGQRLRRRRFRRSPLAPVSFLRPLLWADLNAFLLRWGQTPPQHVLDAPGESWAVAGDLSLWGLSLGAGRMRA